MIEHFFRNKVVQFGIAFAMIVIALLCLFTPDLFILKKGANFTVQIMLAYLLFGLLFLLFNQKKLLLTSFACCGILCLYLKDASNQNLKFPEKTSEPVLSLALVNLSSSGDYKRTMDAINNIEVDLLMFQEVTPDWDMVLKETLSEEYPFMHTVLRIDPYGLACYSKHPLEDIDTFHFSEIPNLYAEIRVGQEYSVNLLSAHTVPPVNSKAYESIREHFDVITGYMKDCSGPSLVMGDFNLPSWAQEIKEFKYIANLNDSRRDIMPTSLQGNISIFNIPVDHIFYSGQLDCTDFQVIEDVSGNHLGIKGTYQFISNQEVPISSGD